MSGHAEGTDVLVADAFGAKGLRFRGSAIHGEAIQRRRGQQGGRSDDQAALLSVLRTLHCTRRSGEAAISVAYVDPQ